MGEIPTMPEDEDERVDECTGRGQLGLLIPLTLRSDRLRVIVRERFIRGLHSPFTSRNPGGGLVGLLFPSPRG